MRCGHQFSVPVPAFPEKIHVVLLRVLLHGNTLDRRYRTNELGEKALYFLFQQAGRELLDLGPGVLVY